MSYNSFGRRKYLLLLSIIIVALSCSMAPARAGNVLPWKKPLPGTAAFLGDDGGGEDTATVCDSAAHYREWLDYGNPPGCRKFPRGLAVIIKGVIYNPYKDTVPGTTMSFPLVKIQIPTKGFVGYLQLFGGIHPRIPQGTIIYLKREGNNVLRLAPSQDAAFDSGPDLGDRATAKVIRYDPATDGAELYVIVINGALTGRTGWVLTSDADSTDGIPVDMFAQAMLTVPRPPNVDRMARLYVIHRSLRAFYDMSVCEAAMVAVSNDQAFKTLEEAYSNKRYYDFPAGTELHVVKDSDPSSLFIVVGDDHGHQGCVSRFALPGYESP